MLRKIISHPLFIFPAAACLFFWPLTFNLFTFKNDALTYYYPVRTLISDALNNGELPLWTPFINMGYPLHADMQSGAWNPIIWIFSFLGQYGLQTFHVEFLLYIGMAGIGFYYLCKNLAYGKTAALAMGLAYQFSGFILDSVQFFNCISAAAYLPFIILFFRQTILQREFKYAFAFSVCLFLMFTGGYPSLFIITCYILAGYLIFFCMREEKRKLFLKRVVPILAMSGLLFIVFSLPAIISFAEHLNEIARGKGQSLATNLENSMNPSTMLSLLSPFATTANNTFLNSSILMRSMYIGLLPLIFFLYTFLHPHLRQNKDLRFYLLITIIMVTMAWGEFFYVRQFAYYVLPLMDSFRHPALFRLFAILFILLIAAAGMQAWINNFQNNGNIKKIILSLVGISIFIALITFLSNGLPFSGANNVGVRLARFYNMHFSERYLLQLPFILLFLSLTFYVIKWKKNAALLVWLLAADLFFATQLNMPVTVIGAKSFKDVNAILSRNPQKFPVPDNRTIEENITALTTHENVASPLPYAKKIGRSDIFITPGNLLRQDSFYYSTIREKVFKQPVVFFSDDIAESATTATITRMSANGIDILTSTPNEQTLVLQQNYYKGWKVTIDGKNTAIHPIHISLMSVMVPPGKHIVSFYYKPRKIIAAFYISMAALLLLTGFLIMLSFSKRRSAKRQPGN